MQRELEIYQVDLHSEFSADLAALLSPEEQQFAKTFRNEKLKTQHLAVRIAVRQILATYLNQATGKINIAKTIHGKPYLLDYPQIQFNLSHSAETLLVAISEIGAIGVDIEYAKPSRRDFSGLVTKCFAKAEQDYWQGLAESDKLSEFYRFWTRKEAFVKAVGHGISMGLQECEIVSGKSPYFQKIPEIYGKPSDWRVFDLALSAHLYGALVIENQQIGLDFSLPEIMPFHITQI